MKKIVVGAVVVACVAAVGLLYASPHIALYNIGKAIERKDADAVSEYVDFPALRENVKGVLLAKMQSEMDKPEMDKPEMKDNPFAGLGQMLAVGMVNQLADTLVSPAGVVAMLENGKPGKPPAASASDTPAAKRRPDFAVDYQGWSKVFVHPKHETSGLVMKRDGLFGWKLVAVKMDTL